MESASIHSYRVGVRARRLIGALVAVTALSLVLDARLAIGANGANGSANAAAGIGTAAALKASSCDPETERIKIPTILAPPCVKPLNGKGNGGSTAQGVTKDTIKVAVLIGTEEADRRTTSGGLRDLSTGQPGLESRGVEDANAVYAHAYETWGRTVVFDYITATGTDEAAQRADALAVGARKPFAVLCAACFISGAGGGAIFNEALVSQNIPAVEVPSKAAETTAPFNAIIAEFIGKSLAGRKARWAGDAALKTQERKFGVVFSPGDDGTDIAAFQKALKKWGAPKAVEVEYVPPLDVSQSASAAQQAAPTLVAKLKDEGVTTVIPLTSPTILTQSLTKAATANSYFPEWMIRPLQDLDFYARQFDQQQWAHAFGPVWFAPYVESASDPIIAVFEWYWGKQRGTYSAGQFTAMRQLYTGIMLGGPNLTRESFYAGLEAFPGGGGACSNHVTSQCTHLKAPRSIAPQVEAAIGWYDPTVTGIPSQSTRTAGTGKLRYMNNAKRYLPGDLPKGEPDLFNPAVAITHLPSIPAGEQVTAYPCTGCPSAGGPGTPSTA